MEKDGRRRLREAVQVAQEVRAEMKDVEGASATHDTTTFTYTRVASPMVQFLLFFIAAPEACLACSTGGASCPVEGGSRS